MTTAEQYDALIIGSGQAGTPLSTALASAGMRTALIERKHVGGTCVNEGCTPTKTMIASGRVAYVTRRAADYGVFTDRFESTWRRFVNASARLWTAFGTAANRRLRD